MNIIKWIVTFAATFYIATLVILYIGQRSFIYLPENRWLDPAQVGADRFETISVNGEDMALKSWWLPPPSQDAAVILHFHGNGGSVAGRASQYEAMAGNEYGLLAAEYPGYAGNPGELSETSFFAAAQAYYDWLRAQGYRADQIIIAGQSLGTGVAIDLASKNKAAGLLLEAPYSSIADVASSTIPWIPVRLLLHDHFDSHSRIGAVNMPIAWAHGLEDEVIAFHFGEKLFAAATNPKCAFRIADAGHNNLWQFGIAPFFRSNVQKMISEKNCIKSDV